MLSDMPHRRSDINTNVRFRHTSTMSNSHDDAFVVLEPQSEGDNASITGSAAPKLPHRPLRADRPNFLVITADSMYCAVLSRAVR